MKLTALYQIRLTKTSPAPPILYSFKIEGATAQDRKRVFYNGLKAMQDKFPAHKVFEKLLLVADASAEIAVTDGEMNVYLPDGEEM